MVGLDTQRLTRDSDIIIVGEVECVEPYWSDDGKSIYTVVDVLVNDIIAGTSHELSIQVEHLGGMVDDIGMGVSDEPAFREGEEVLLFLRAAQGKTRRKHAPAVYNVTGAAQGKYTIDTEGVAHKGGFSVLRRDKDIVEQDMHIDLYDLIEKIKQHR